jgi:hypothetical protein
MFAIIWNDACQAENTHTYNAPGYLSLMNLYPLIIKYIKYFDCGCSPIHPYKESGISPPMQLKLVTQLMRLKCNKYKNIEYSKYTSIHIELEK